MNRMTKTKYFVKVIDIRFYSETEISALQKCQGRTKVVNLIEEIKKENEVFIITELLSGGELLQRIKEHTRFTESLAKRYFKQIVDGTAYIHSKNIVHRDLKPENIIFASKNADDLRIVDFGFARRPSIEGEIGSVAYTLNYAAPEA
jgi:serine/threonine protein kinase